MIDDCIVYRCKAKRVSGFCKVHKAEHEKSKWQKAFIAWNKEVAKVGDYRKVPWVAP